MALVNVTYRMQTHGYGVSQIEAEGLADTFINDGAAPGDLVSRTVELEPEDGLTAEGARLMAEDELPGRYVQPGFRFVDGDDRDD